MQQDTPIPWTAVDYDQIYGEIVDLLAEAGVPAPPRGRLWLVKLPDEFSTIEQLTTRLVTVAEAAGVPPACSSEFIALVRQELSRWW